MIIVEITKNNETLPAGEKREITFTNLCNYVGPIIRYNLGDIGFCLKRNAPAGDLLS